MVPIFTQSEGSLYRAMNCNHPSDHNEHERCKSLVVGAHWQEIVPYRTPVPNLKLQDGTVIGASRLPVREVACRLGRFIIKIASLRLESPYCRPCASGGCVRAFLGNRAI